MKFGKEFASYQIRLQESTDLPALFPQVDYRALKKILRRCISSHALRTELRAQAVHSQAELHAEEAELRAQEETHAAEAESHADGTAEAAQAEADAGRGAADAGREEADAAELKPRSAAGCAVTSCTRGELPARTEAATAAPRVAGQEAPDLKHSAENCAVTFCARGELSAPAATLVAAAAAAENAPTAAPLVVLPAAAAAKDAPPAVADAGASGCAQCDAEFFGLLEAELMSIERSFNSTATRLLSCHNARGLRLMCHVLSPRQLFSAGGHSGRSPRWHSHKPAALLRAATSLLEHLAISFLATHKILKKYIKVHRRSSLGVCDAREAALAAPESWESVIRLRRLQGRIVRSPLLIEVTAMAANLELKMSGGRRGGQGGGRRGERGGLGGGEKGDLVGGKKGRLGTEKSRSKKSGTQGSGDAASVCPLLGSELLLKAEFRARVDVTCPVCLEVPFDPVSLACTHIFCRGCACSVAHVPVFFGLDSASPHITCPLCRQQGVFRQPRSLRELHRLIMARQPEQWKARRDEEQKRRLEEERRYWDGQMRIAMHMSFASLQTRRTPARAAYANPHGGRTPGAPSPLTQYSARIEQLHSTATKAVESAATTAFNSAPTSSVAASSPSLSPFRQKINEWWADHLVSKANFVEAAAPCLPSDDEEEFVILKPPVEVDSKFQLPQKGPEVNY
ncbi:unnamed protein product [Closterium sp. Yama58-4]|nr:unnamed protein product [Closterium sp. Yama58-4]